MSTNRVGTAWGRALAVVVATALAAAGSVVGTTVAHAAGKTYEHADGATVSYNDEVRVGKNISISGTGWLAKPEMVEEGEEGSVIGFKLIDSTLGQLSRTFDLDNPRLGEPVTNLTVWGTVWADSDGSFELELPWPDASNAAADPAWEAGDQFTLQLLSGTMYSDQAGVDPSQRPDVSRTIPLTITVVADEEPPAALEVSQQPEAASVASGVQASFTAATTGGKAPVTVQWQRSIAASATNPPPTYTNLTAAQAVDGSQAEPTLVVAAGTSPNINNRWYRAIFTDADGSTATTDAVKLSIIAVPTVATQPLGQTVRSGETATFSAVATSAVSMTFQWQSTKTTLANGEPDDSTWSDVPGATADTLEVEGTDADAQDGTFYRLQASNVSGTAASRAAQLRFYEKLDTTASVTVTGTTYGPSGTTPKEFSVSAPNAVVKGEDIVIEGFNYLAVDGKAGSVANALVDAEYSGDPRTLNTTRTVYNPQTATVVSDKRGHNVVQAGGSDGNEGGQTIVAEDGTAQLVTYPDWAPGYFRVVIPWPDETNTTQSAEFFAENWKAGTQHTVRFLTGTLFQPSGGDYQGGISARFTIVDEPTVPTEPEGPDVALARTSVEQGDHVWFDLTGFSPGTTVIADLVNASGQAVASVSFDIGSDGGIVNHDGQTYKRVTAPRDAAPGSYTVRVRTGEDILATSETVTIAAATTRVYNPGDHAGGAEDLLVQRGGVWTFIATAFAPNGVLRATAEVDGETVTLSGIGQISDIDLGWQLDGNGDTSRADYTRVRIPGSVAEGEIEVTFGDGTNTVKRTLVIEAPEAASIEVASTAVVGGTIRVTGTGFFHPSVTDQGSRIAIKIDDGAYSRTDASLHSNRTIWYIVDADTDGNFEVDMPLPNGTTSDDAEQGTYGSSPAFTPGDHTLRFLTGSLLAGDTSRTLQSTVFTVTGAPEPDPELQASTPTVSGAAQVGQRLTVDPGTWGPAPVQLAYQWLADGTAITGATGIGYTVAAADLGKQLSVAVTGTKDGYPSVTTESAKTAKVVAASAPVSVLRPSISGTPAVGSTLKATSGTWDTSGLSFAYQWLRNGAAINGATSTSYKVVSADAGKSLSVRVTASKAGAEAGVATSVAVKAGKKLTKTPTPTVSGTAKVGKTLKAKAGSWAPSKVTLKYQWLRDGQPISKATKSSYKLVKADAGRKITVRVTGSKSGYVSVVKTSKAKSVAKVKASVKVSVPSKVARGKQATVKVTVTAPVKNPTGTVKVTVNGKSVTVTLTAAGKGKVSVKLPAIKKKGSYKVKASFSPSGATKTSTAKSSTVSKTLKVR